MGFPGLGDAAPERYALYLLNDIIGGSMSSRLFQEVRERQGLVYSVHSGDAGLPRQRALLRLRGDGRRRNFGKVVKALMKELRALKKDGVTADELRAGQGSPQGQPDALARVDVEPHEPARQAGDALRLVPTRCDEMLADDRRACGPRRSDGPRPALLDEEQLSLVALGPDRAPDDRLPRAGSRL